MDEKSHQNPMSDGWEGELWYQGCPPRIGRPSKSEWYQGRVSPTRLRVSAILETLKRKP